MTMADKYRYIGNNTPRIDAKDMVTGGTRFFSDITFPDLLHGKVLRSPNPHALIKRIDKTKAEALEGVKAVLTWEDIPRWQFGTPPVFPLLSQKVHYVGDAVALVAAETEEIAENALGLIDVEYDVLPAVFDIEDAIKPGAPQLYDDFPGNILPSPEVMIVGMRQKEIVMGDTQKGFEEADVTAEGTFGYQNIPNPIPAEPPGAVAYWEAPNKVTVWSTTQGAHLAQILLSEILGENIDVRVIGCTTGGSYGTKLMAWQVQCYVIALSRATGKKVKVVYTKDEHLAAFVLRPEMRIHAKVGLKNDGTVTAIKGNLLVGTGHYSLTTHLQVAVGTGEAQIAIRCANWDLKSSVVCTNRNASGIVRGFGGQELKCALIPLLSMAMEKASVDPFEFLKKNFVKPGEGYIWRDAEWYTYRGIDFSKAMDRGAEQFGWEEKWKGWLKPTSVDGAVRTGIGVGVHGNADVGEDDSETWVRINFDGKVVIHCCLVEIGTGQRTSCAQAVGEILQIPISQISFTDSDTHINPFEFGTFGSRGTYAILSGVIQAAEDARKKLLGRAAPMLGGDPQDLETADGFIWINGKPEKRVHWREVMGLRTILGTGRYDADYTLSNCMMSFVEVAVDTETGKTTLMNVVNATDAGRIINPQGLEGQLNGCLGTAGIDSALFEETVIDPSTGCMLNSNMIDYKWRTSMELPPIDNVVLETPFPTHRFRAIGVGEIATSPGPSAVLMAVSNAIGVRLHDYPATPERILKALGKISDKKKGGSA